MHAIVMRQYGPPEALTWVELPPVALRPDEIRIRTIASAVNHTDLEIRAGNWPVHKWRKSRPRLIARANCRRLPRPARSPAATAVALLAPG